MTRHVDLVLCSAVRMDKGISILGLDAASCLKDFADPVSHHTSHWTDANSSLRSSSRFLICCFSSFLRRFSFLIYFYGALPLVLVYFYAELIQTPVQVARFRLLPAHRADLLEAVRFLPFLGLHTFYADLGDLELVLVLLVTLIIIVELS